MQRDLLSQTKTSPSSLSIWDLWWTKWHWDRFFIQYFSFPLSISFHQCSIHIHPSTTKLYNVSLPVLQFPLSVSFHQCSIHIHPSTTTLYNVSLPALQFPLSVSFHQCSILIHPSTTTLYNVSLPVLQFPLSVSFHQCSTLIFIYTLSYQKDRRTKPMNLPKSNALLKNEKHWLAKYFHSVLKGLNTFNWSCIVALVLYLGVTWRWMVNITPRHIYPR
jgi:hypothetical protein